MLLQDVLQDSGRAGGGGPPLAAQHLHWGWAGMQMATDADQQWRAGKRRESLASTKLPCAQQVANAQVLDGARAPCTA